jgi:hypothetical protein
MEENIPIKMAAAPDELLKEAVSHPMLKVMPGRLG